MELKTEKPTVPTSSPFLLEFRCFYCQQPADRIAYYTKYYPDFNNESIEYPVLCCDKCYLCDEMKRDREHRGGMEGITNLPFKIIGAMGPKRIGYYLSSKTFLKNHFANQFWRKLFWRIHYRHLKA